MTAIERPNKFMYENDYLVALSTLSILGIKSSLPIVIGIPLRTVQMTTLKTLLPIKGNCLVYMRKSGDLTKQCLFWRLSYEGNKSSLCVGNPFEEWTIVEHFIERIAAQSLDFRPPLWCQQKKTANDAPDSGGDLDLASRKAQTNGHTTGLRHAILHNYHSPDTILHY